MAEAAFKQMIATFIRQTRPQSFRRGKPLRYPQRTIANVATHEVAASTPEHSPQWQAHPLVEHDVHTTDNASRLQRLRRDPEPRSFSSFLTDNYAREHNYLRISVTERCNLRCLYCMPEEGVPLSPPAHNLTTPEIVYLSSLFVSEGVNKIRLTGGEPTVRKDILDLMRQIGSLRTNGLKELCLTTNGISLHRKLDAMVDAGLTGINLSLDTLDPFQFTLMTRRNGHEAVMKSIQRILDLNKAGAGIKLKINCVVMRGVNEREILPFVEMGKEQDLEVRFIEYMPFDGNKWSEKKMLSFQEMLAMIQEKYPDVHKVQGHANDTSKTYKVPGFLGRIGFITSMTHNFCGTCNRLRITSDGNLKVCLFGNSEVSLRDILRESNSGQPIEAEAMDAINQIEMARRHSSAATIGQQALSEPELRLLEVIGAAVKRKKAKHAGMGELENMKNRPMILIDHESRPIESCAQNHPFNPAVPNFQIVRPTTNQSLQIPLHMLSSRIPHSQRPYGVIHQYISKHAYRSIASQGSFRRIPSEPKIRNASQAQDAKSPKTKSSKVFPSSEGSNRPPRLNGLSASNKGSNSTRRILTHLTTSGAAHMVDISEKKETVRTATAKIFLYFSRPETLELLMSSTLKKGDALAVARIAAIQAAKKTADLIPLAHPGLGLTGVNVELQPVNPPPNPPPSEIDGKKSPPHYGGISARVIVSCYGKTGVEMEALMSATVAILTLYDMLKAVDKGMRIANGQVLSKTGGKSGDWVLDPRTHRITKRRRDSAAVRKEGHADTTETTDKEPQSTERELSAEEIDADHADSHETPADEVEPYTTANMKLFEFLPENERLNVIRQHLQHRQERLQVEREKLNLQQRKFMQERYKLQLSSIEIEQEVSRRVNEILKRGAQEQNVNGQTQHDMTIDPSYASKHGESDHTPSEPPQSADSSADDHHQDSNPQHSSDEPVDPGSSNGSTTEEIKFDRTSRDLMSGTYNNRTDRQAFEVRRTERYEDWARER